MPHRADLLSKLNRYKPLTPEEQSAWRRMRDFVERTPRCFDRSTVEGHITGSAFVVNRDGTKVLLTHHRKLDIWLQLGGHADGNCDILAVALREAQEESGLQDIQVASDDIFDVDVHAIPAMAHEAAHFHYDVRFLFWANDQAPLVISAESKRLAWVSLDEIQQFTQEVSMIRMAQKAREFVRTFRRQRQ